MYVHNQISSILFYPFFLISITFFSVIWHDLVRFESPPHIISTYFYKKEKKEA